MVNLVSVKSKQLNVIGEISAVYNKCNMLYGVQKAPNISDTIILINLLDGASYSIDLLKPRWRDWYDKLFAVSSDQRYVALLYEDTLGPVYREFCYIYDLKNQEFLDGVISTDMIHKTSFGVGVDVTVGHSFDYMEFLSDNDRLLLVTVSGEVMIWSMSQQRMLWAVGSSSHTITGFALSHRFKTFVTAENTAYVRAGMLGPHYTQYETLHLNRDHRQYKRPVGRFGKSDKLNVGDYLRLWNIYSSELLQEFDIQTQIEHLQFSPSDSLLAGTEMRVIRKFKHRRSYGLGNVAIWNIKTGQKIQTLPEPAKPIGFTQDDGYLVVQLDDTQIRFWDVQTESWHESYQFDGVITSAQMTDNDTMVALERRDKVDGLPEWYIHQIVLD